MSSPVFIVDVSQQAPAAFSPVLVLLLDDSADSLRIQFANDATLRRMAPRSPLGESFWTFLRDLLPESVHVGLSAAMDSAHQRLSRREPILLSLAHEANDSGHPGELQIRLTPIPAPKPDGAGRQWMAEIDWQEPVLFMPPPVSASDAQSEKRLLTSLLAENLLETDVLAAAIGRWETGELLDVNEAWLNLIGYSREDLLSGRVSCRDLTPPEFHAEDDKAREVLRRDGRVQGYEKQFMHRDGRRVDVTLSAYRLQRPGQEPLVGYFVMDVTAQKQALNDSRSRLDSIVNSDLLGIIVADGQGRILEANPTFESLSGYTIAEIQANGLTWQDLTPPELLPQDLQKAEETVRTGTIAPYEKQYIRKDGSRVDILIGASKIGPDRYIGFMLDISDLKRTQRSYNRSQALLRNVSESGLLGIVKGDFDGTVVEANDAFLHLIGASREELAARQINWHALTPPELLAVEEGKLSELLSSGTIAPYEKQYVLKDGRRVDVLVGVSLISEPEDGKGPLLAAFVLDITQSKRTEQALAASEARLKRLFDSQLVGICTANQLGQLLDVNEALANMLGYAREEFLASGLGWQQLTPEAYLPQDERLWQQLLTEGAFQNAQKQFIHRDGHAVDVIFGAAMLDD